MIETSAILLSEAQIDIVKHPLPKPGVVDAGAGTGKTFTIVERAAQLHETGQCPAERILLLTFARKAAAELRGRIARRLANATPPHCSTFHAFAWGILSAHAYEIGLSPETAVIEDVEARVEFRKAFGDYLNDPQARDSGFPLRPFNRGEICDGLFTLSQDLKQRGVSIESFRDAALAAADEFGRIRYRELRSYYKRKIAGQEYKVIAQASDEQLAREVREEKQRVAAAAEILERFELRLAARNALTYSDIMVRAERALRANPALRDQLRERYRCCIVDEYQDTDLTQHRFLEALFGGEFAYVMVVGDVLQSIHGFRGAHPENVRAFREAPESVVYPLHENRRSLQEILDLAQHAVVPAHADAPLLVGQRGRANKQIVHVSSLWMDARGASHDYVPADEARKLEAAVVARRICRLLASGALVESAGAKEAVAPKHIAILSRTKTKVQPVTDALLAAGVPFRLVGGVGFYDAPEIRDVLAFVRLLADPFDAHSVARALASPAIAASDAVVAQLARDLRPDETAFARRVLIEPIARADVLGVQAREAAAKLRRLLDSLAPHAALPLTSALRAVLEQTGVEHLYRCSSDPRAAQARANLEKLETLARKFADASPGAQPADFVSFIDELERVEFDEREADVPSWDAVTISTIHSAKGLEWPFVFVLGVWPELHARPRMFVDQASGALLYAEEPDGSRSFHYESVKKMADAAGIVRERSDDEIAEDEAEERRLFYVAITRARDRVYISGLRGKPSQQNPNGKPHRFLEDVYDWLRDHAWDSDEDVPEAPPLEWPTRVQAAPVAARAPQHASFPVRESALTPPLSYSLIAGYEQCPRRITYRLMSRLPQVGGPQKLRAHARRADEALDAEDLAPADSLLSAGEYGLVLHKALELWALEKRAGISLRSPAAYVSDAAQVLELAPARTQTRSAVRAMEQIVRELGAWKPVHVEAPFTLDFGDEGKPLLVSGYLDLLAQDAEKRGCLVDYKTGAAGRAEYSLQLALYRAAAREVYGLDAVHCFIGRVSDEGFSLQPVDPASDAELRQRITRVRDGLLARDDRPLAGPWCATCGYRGAPCQDYARTKRT